MSITDELRKWGYGFCGDTHDVVTAIADRIDAEHDKAMIRAGQLLDDAEKERDYNYANWQECKQKVLQGSITFDELNAMIEYLKNKLSHCIELPKDMDGEYIHIGDVMEWSDGTTFEVVGIGDDTLFYVETDENGSSSIEWTSTEQKRHHQPDTWERIIEDAIRGEGGSYGCLEERFDAMVPALVARCKALAGDAE